MSTTRLRLIGLTTGIVCLAIVVAMILLGGQTASAAPTTFHVAPGGDCGGAPYCYGTIQAAVDAAADGDTIKVAEGTYTSTGAEVVYIDSAITLVGGYAITNWDQSDPETQPTIIDAEDEYRRGVYIDGTGVPTVTLRALTVQNAKPEDLDGAGIYVENAKLRLQDSTVRYNANTEGAGGGGLYARDCTMILTGNKVHENNAAGGGGLRVEGTSQVTISGNQVLSNTAFFNGGLLLGGSTVATVRDNIFRDNFGGQGGGIGVGGTAFVTLSGNTFLGNSTAMSKPGGGLLVDGGTVMATGNHFEENSAHDGAGIYVDNPDASVTLSENTFVSNHASTDGGQGGALFVNHGTVLVQGNTIQNNNGAGGGGIHIGGGTVTLHGNQILGNTAFFGGALSVGGAVVYLTGNTFRDNFGGHGGGILLWENAGTVQMSGNAFHGNDSSPDQGPSLLIQGGTVDAQNDLIADSANADGEAVSVWGGTLTARHWTLVNNGSYALTTYDDGSAELINTLVVSHTLGGLWGAGTVADTTLFYNSPATCGGGATCTNNLSGDPRFVSGATGNYHIDSDSAAIDAGVDAGVYVDIDGQPRPAGEGFDIGADEFMYSVFLPLVMRSY